VANTYAHYNSTASKRQITADIFAILSGILAMLAFLMLPWLTLSTPVIEIFKLDVDAQFLASVAGALPGGMLVTLWLVPLAAVAIVGVSAFGLMNQNGATRIVGIAQIVASLGLLLPVIAVIYTYMNFLDSLRKLIPVPIPLPIEAVIYPSLGLYLTALSFAVCLAAGILNLRTQF
jgi:hypothetical protein